MKNLLTALTLLLILAACTKLLQK